MRIALMILRLIIPFPYYLFRMIWLGKHRSIEETYKFVQNCAKRANQKGRVKLEVSGTERLPDKDGFVIFPNHQGMYDLLVFLDSCPRPFSFVAKIELKNIPLLKDVFKALRCILIDRKDLRQSMAVIKEMTERVTNGENFLIFAEGTRSKLGNKMLEMKPGSFKSAVKAKAPIVPCALMDCFIPFDEKSIRPVSVKAVYLDPIYYEEYKDMTTVEIAQEVKSRIEKTIEETLSNTKE